MTQVPQYKVPALDKGLDILEALAADSVPQSLADLANHLDRSSSELFRMLNCLEQRHYIQRDPVSGKYRLSLKLYALSHTHSAVERLVESAHVPMQELTEKVRESCHLSLLDRGRLLVVSQIESPAPIRLSIEVGARFDSLLTVSGRLLLSRLSEDERLEQLQGSQKWSRSGSAARKKILKEIDQLQGQDFSAAFSDSVEGVEDIATDVGQANIGLVAALTMTRFQPRKETVKKSALINSIRQTAAEITTTLGLLK